MNESGRASSTESTPAYKILRAEASYHGPHHSVGSDNTMRALSNGVIDVDDALRRLSATLTHGAVHRAGVDSQPAAQRNSSPGREKIRIGPPGISSSVRSPWAGALGAAAGRRGRHLSYPAAVIRLVGGDLQVSRSGWRQTRQPAAPEPRTAQAHSDVWTTPQEPPDQL